MLSPMIGSSLDYCMQYCRISLITISKDYGPSVHLDDFNESEIFTYVKKSCTMLYP